jgi:beta-mannosidase
VRRLSSHPSIVMWDGCNECHVVLNTSTGIYATFVMTVVAEEDGMFLPLHFNTPIC